MVESFKFYGINREGGEERLENLIKMNEFCQLRLYFDNKDKDYAIKKLQEIKNKIQGTKLSIFSVNLIYEKDYIDDSVEIESLKSFAKECEELEAALRLSFYNKNDEYSDYIDSDINQYFIAKKKVNDFAEKVKNFSIKENGEDKQLSVFEKFMLVYRFVSNRKYNRSDNFMDLDMRNWVGVLTTDKIICSGYASLLRCLCNRIFSDDELKCFYQSVKVKNKYGKFFNHANNIIYIKDDKYGINGMFYCDSCFDCEKENNDSTFEFFMLPYQELNKYNKADLIIKGHNIILESCGLKPLEDVGFADRYYFKHEMDKFLFNKFLPEKGKTFEGKIKKMIKNNEKVFKPAIIPDNLLKKGFKAVAIFEGKREEEVDDFVEQKFKQTKNLLEENFVNFGKDIEETETSEELK